MMEIVKSFTFDAAHRMPTKGPDHAYGRMHGHSFAVEVTLKGEPDETYGWIEDLGVVAEALADVRARLDHQLLNEIEGLETPTLENLCLWIAAELKPRLPQLAAVKVGRPTIGEACQYNIP
ncbi:MAG: 6-carboxytetrahydropterin synthase [Pseudomonadota bacterium]